MPVFSRLAQPGNGFQLKLFQRINILIDRHSMAAQYYAKWNRYMAAPSIGITCLSSIAAFLSTADRIDSDAKYGLSISVGIMASVSTLLQAISNGYRFSAKEEMHRKTADEYNKLNIKLCFEMECPNDIKFMENIETKILDIQNISNSFVPQFIIDKVSEIHKQNPPQPSNLDMVQEKSPYPSHDGEVIMHIARSEMPMSTPMRVMRTNSNSTSVYDIDEDSDLEQTQPRPSRQLPLIPNHDNSISHNEVDVR
jgi:hypothetical protein